MPPLFDIKFVSGVKVSLAPPEACDTFVVALILIPFNDVQVSTNVPVFVESVKFGSTLPESVKVCAELQLASGVVSITLKDRTLNWLLVRFQPVPIYLPVKLMVKAPSALIFFVPLAKLIEGTTAVCVITLVLVSVIEASLFS